jgi:hypothetical protein
MNSQRLLSVLNLLLGYTFAISLVVGTHDVSRHLVRQASTKPTTQAATRPSPGVILLGTVCTSDDSLPVSDAKVLLRSSQKFPADKLAASSKTNRVGAFCIDRYISQGSYRISVLDQNGNAIASESLTIAKSDKPVMTLSLVAYKASLEGSVLDAFGKPASGVEIIFAQKDSDDFFRTKTDKDGHYIIKHIADGAYMVIPQVDLEDKNGMLRPLNDVKIDGGHVMRDIRLDRDAIGK